MHGRLGIQTEELYSALAVVVWYIGVEGHIDASADPASTDPASDVATAYKALEVFDPRPLAEEGAKPLESATK